MIWYKNYSHSVDILLVPISNLEMPKKYTDSAQFPERPGDSQIVGLSGGF